MQGLLEILPTVNAVLISTSGLFIVAGLHYIRRGQRERHQQAMLTATALAGLFLVLYLLRISLGGLTPFRGPDPARAVYLVILASHVVLAMVQAPMSLVTVYKGLRGDYPGHRRLGRVTYPIWLYVSVTGLLVYTLLHRIW